MSLSKLTINIHIIHRQTLIKMFEILLYPKIPIIYSIAKQSPAACS